MTKEQKRIIKRYFYSESSKPIGLLPSILSRIHKSMHGEARLLIALMESSVVEEDLKYIYGGELKKHCKLLDLNYNSIRKAFKLMVK